MTGAPMADGCRRHRGHRLARVLAASLVVGAAACSSGDGGATGGAGTTTAPGDPTTVPATGSSVADLPAEPLPRVGLYYQAVRPGEDLSKLGDLDVVVLVRQGDEAAAVAAVHETGAKAFRYVQSYWFPAGRDYDGLDIGEERGLAYCASGTTPLVGREQGGTEWYFFDANERAARDHFVELLGELAAAGYDGIMFDRGLAALTGDDATRAGIWDRPSTCTEDPVVPGAPFADAYVGLMGEVHRAGLELFQNYGYSPFHPLRPFRPDPTDAACRAGELATCRRLDDAFAHVDLFLNEAAAHPRDVEWDNDFAANRANEVDPRFGGRVVGLVTEGTLGGDVSREAVFFQVARIRLFDMPVAVFTGDDDCRGAQGLCNRRGLYPEVVSLDLGPPVDPEPRSADCVAGSPANCVWSRRYERGTSVVNVTDEPRTVRVELGVEGCRRVTDLYAGADLEGGACVDEVTLDLPPWSGRLLRVEPA